jgi:hypothetical protein
MIVSYIFYQISIVIFNEEYVPSGLLIWLICNIIHIFTINIEKCRSFFMWKSLNVFSNKINHFVNIVYCRVYKSKITFFYII